MLTLTLVRGLLDVVRLHDLHEGTLAKLLKVRGLLRRFFRETGEEEQGGKAGEGQNGKIEKRRVVILVAGRKVAIELVSWLEQVPFVKAGLWVGKNSGSKVSIVECELVFNRFATSELNTLVMTGIEDECFNPGTVHLLICFDTGLSWIRNFAREVTVHKPRIGRIIVLLTENEYKMHSYSQISQVKLLQRLKRKEKLTDLNFYSFNPRMIPSDKFPALQYEGKFSLHSDHHREVFEIEKELDKLIEDLPIIDQGEDMLEHG